MALVTRLLGFGGSVVALVAFGCAAGNDEPDGGVGGSGGSPPPKEVSAKGITITDVDLYQTIEVPLVRAGVAAASDVPIVAGKDAFLRVGFTLDPAFTPREIRVKVTLESASTDVEPVDAKAPLNAPSSHGSVASTLNVVIPGASILADTTFRIDLFEANPDAKVSDPAGVPGYPESGTVALGAKYIGEGTRIVLVPIVYNADGSGRTPDTSDAQLELYRSLVQAMYPTPVVNLEVGAAWSYNGADVQAFGNGWDNILTAFANAHHGAGSDPKAYYYGLFQPASSFNQYCQGGCVTGLSFGADDPNYADARSSVSLGFSGSDFAETFAHELGHAHGQLGHSPCGGAGSVDPQYPHSGGSIGVFGMDVATQTLKDPSLKDLMGYCPNTWISDYNYKNFFERTKALGQSAFVKHGPPERWRAYSVGLDGQLYDAGTSERTIRPGGDPAVVHMRDATGAMVEREGYYLAADHLPVGMLLVRDEPGLVAASLTRSPSP